MSTVTDPSATAPPPATGVAARAVNAVKTYGSGDTVVHALDGVDLTLRGGEVHTRVSGVADHLAENDEHALQIVRDIIATLPPSPARARRIPVSPWPSPKRRAPSAPAAGCTP